MVDQVQLLTSAFNNLKQYSDSSFVIQCNGSILEDDNLLASFAEDISSLQNAGVNIIIVHDGNNIVNSLVDKFSLKGMSANLRTGQASVEVVEMILSGYVNQRIVGRINQEGGCASGISGKDGQFITARRAKVARYEYSASDKVLNFGFLGELSLINPDLLFLLEENGMIPVISPISLGEDSRTYKIDANDISSTIAAVLGVKKLIIISDSPGIIDSKEEVIQEVNIDDITKMVNEETDNTELSCNLRAGLMALEHNTEMVHLLDGKIPHVIMRQLFTDELVGTTIKNTQSY
jgi:acetylglutamate kinase